MSVASFFARGQYIVVAAIGAGLGFLLPRLAHGFDGGWITWGLIAAGLAMAALILLKTLGLVRENIAALLLGTAFGPLLGLIVGGWIWHSDVLSLREPLGSVLSDLGLPLDWIGAMILGGVAGVLAVVLVAQRWPVLAAAAFGLFPGAMMGLHGSWSAGVWFIAPFVSGFAFMLVGSSAALACMACHKPYWVLIGPAIGAVVGAVICGGTELLASPLAGLCDKVGLSHGVQVVVLDILALPNGLANFAGFSGGFLGGAAAGASIGAIVASFVAAPPLGLLLGALLGIVDHVAGGALFAELFADWRAGAITGSLIAALTVACTDNLSDGEREDRVAIAFVAFQAIFFGCVAGGLAAWLGYEQAIAVGAGGLAGLLMMKGYGKPA